MAKTKVIFRKWKDGEIIALFPEDLGTNSPYTCACYQHTGQHGACDPGIVSDTKLATPDEYRDLRHELENLHPEPYDLQIIQKVTRRHLETRRAALAAIYAK